jgi:lysophospholipase L1-like esterase
MKNVIANASIPAAPVAMIALALALGAGCGGSEETSPFAKNNPPTDTGNPNNPNNPPTGPGTTLPGTDDAGTTTPSDAGVTPPQTVTGIGCGHTPARYVVLGHSVAHCFAVGGVDSETCSIKNTHTFMATKFPGIKYENYAVDGAVIADVLKSQLPKVPGGSGHVFVNLFIGGNDLAAHLYESDAQAKKSWDAIKPKATADLEAILAAFDDATRFPDKATILINSQYNPFDECTAGTYSFVTTVKQTYILEYNKVLASLLTTHKNAVLVDQYTTFLGHGHNYNQSKCPKYVAGYDYWMADMIHPNEKGHVNLSKEMQATVTDMYTCK